MLRTNFDHGFSESDWNAAKEEARQAMIAVARRGNLIYYSELVKKIKSCVLEPHGSPLAHMLGEISSEEDDKGRWLLTAIVVRKEDGMPGQGFVDLAKSRGRNVKDRETFWTEEVRKVHDVWSRKPAR